MKKTKMKHVELFENFQQTINEMQNSFLVGFYGEGGYGSHPAILTRQELIRNGFEESPSNGEWHFKNYGYFVLLNEYPTLPEALLSVFNDTYQWDIRGISSSMAKSIMDVMGDDHIDNAWLDDENDSKINRIEKMAGLPGHEDESFIAVIPKTSPNKVYWSDNPEESQGYWEPPYRAMTLEDVLDKFE